MNFKSEQEVFDFVVGALIAQGRPSVVRDSSEGPSRTVCKYRSEDGAKCAGGHVIPDEIYTRGMEGCSIRTIVINAHSPTLMALRPYADLLIDLQNNHDRAALRHRPEDENDAEWLRLFKEGAQKTAYIYNLVPKGLA